LPLSRSVRIPPMPSSALEAFFSRVKSSRIWVSLGFWPGIHWCGGIALVKPNFHRTGDVSLRTMYI
jgi:hypothetical protein